MDQRQKREFAITAAVIAFSAAAMSGRFPQWLRVTIIVVLITLAAGVGGFGYRYYTLPTTLTVAAGSLDGEAFLLMTKIATRLASSRAPVRLKVLDKKSVLESAKAFSSGLADLTVTRADVGDLSTAAVVAVITRGVVLIVAPAGSSISDMDDLETKTIGVIGGEANRRLVEALKQEYGWSDNRTHFKDLTISEVPQALKSKQVHALLVVMPLTEKYLTILRSLLPTTGKQKPVLIPIESAGAIAAVATYYQSYDLPKGTLQGSPPIPDDDIKTLHVPFYLLANKKLSDDVVGSLAKAVMDARRDLINEFPLIARISEPDTDKTDADHDTYLPVHPGAAAYFSGNQQSFFDKYSNQILYGSMLIGTLTSLFAAAWKFVTKDEQQLQQRPLIRLYALTDQISQARSETELLDTEHCIDEILKRELESYVQGKPETSDSAVLGLATQRLQHLIGQQRAKLNMSRPSTLLNAS
jgi:TRAP transporter TAXI family solute receptor